MKTEKAEILDFLKFSRDSTGGYLKARNIPVDSNHPVKGFFLNNAAKQRKLQESIAVIAAELSEILNTPSLFSGQQRPKR